MCDIYHKCPRHTDFINPHVSALICPHKMICALEMFRCVRTLQCISPQFHCDGQLDCGNGDTSDEDGCPPQRCTERQTRCLDGQCMATESFCDGQRQCADDELPSICGEFVINCLIFSMSFNIFEKT